MSDNILVLAPHADDEVIGCGGLICRRVSEGHRVDVVIAALGGIKHRHLDSSATLTARRLELQRAKEILGVTEVMILYENMDMKLETISQLEIVTRLDEILDRGYDEVYFPYPSHNQDHQELYRAAYAALREKVGVRSPRLSALYECPFIGWSPSEIRGGKLYIDIQDYVEQKIAALEAYESQVRRFPHPCSPQAIRILAEMRGVESGFMAAELFYLQKMIL